MARISAANAFVASHVGAWIETYSYQLSTFARTVASHVGAWIETQDKMHALLEAGSRPTWARGLKPKSSAILHFDKLSRPTWARGLKQGAVAHLQICECRVPRGRVD